MSKHLKQALKISNCFNEKILLKRWEKGKIWKSLFDFCFLNMHPNQCSFFTSFIFTSLFSILLENWQLLRSFMGWENGNWELYILIQRILSIYIFNSIAFAHINGRKSLDSLFFFCFFSFLYIFPRVAKMKNRFYYFITSVKWKNMKVKM